MSCSNGQVAVFLLFSFHGCGFDSEPEFLPLVARLRKRHFDTSTPQSVAMNFAYLSPSIFRISAKIFKFFFPYKLSVLKKHEEAIWSAPLWRVQAFLAGMNRLILKSPAVPTSPQGCSAVPFEATGWVLLQTFPLLYFYFEMFLNISADLFVF